MKTTRGFWRSRPAIDEQSANGVPESVEPKRPRRRWKVILTLALAGSVGGFLISYAFQPNYTSQSMILVEGQRVSPEYVQRVVVVDLAQQVETLKNQILSSRHLLPMIQDLDLAKPGEEDSLMEHIRSTFHVTPEPSTWLNGAADETTSKTRKEPAAAGEPAPFLLVSYTDSNPVRAQKICNAMTSLFLEADLSLRAEVTKSTTDFLSRQVEDARHALLDQASALAISKSRSPRGPEEEAKQKILALDYDMSEQFYKDLLTKKRSAELAAKMDADRMGEVMTVLMSANRPWAPEFPDRSLFALAGLCTGLILGIGRLLWPATRILFQRIALFFPSTEIA